MIPSGRARLAGVLGWPVGHSLSPRLHGFWLQRYQIDGAYVALGIRPEHFSDAFLCLPKMGFRGFNVTVPHKAAAAALVDDLDQTARAVGAVNTVIVESDGRSRGLNTDVLGFLENLDESQPGWRFRSTSACVVGAGGAARAVVFALLSAGISKILLTNRTTARAEAFARDFGAAVEIVPWGDRSACLADVDVLVNASSLGMEGSEPLLLPLERLSKMALVTDLVYKPLETELLCQARFRGNPMVDGLGMLLHQAKLGFEAWFGTRPVVDQAVREFVLGQTAAPAKDRSE